MIIIQIGANRGNDDLTKIINDNEPDLLLLVEPLKVHNENLEKNYSWVKNLYIENIAISDITNDEIDFYYHLDDGPGYEVASIYPEHIYERHLHLSKDRIEKISVKTMIINDLFEKYNLTNIDILFIDAEGNDDTIIKSIDFSKFNIKYIYFENLHIKDNNIYDFLKHMNYSILTHTGTNNWCSLATKN